jgi:hypothetical protein
VGQDILESLRGVLEEHLYSFEEVIVNCTMADESGVYVLYNEQDELGLVGTTEIFIERIINDLRDILELSDEKSERDEED